MFPTPPSTHLFTICAPSNSLAQKLVAYFKFPFIDASEDTVLNTSNPQTTGPPPTDAENWERLIQLRERAARFLEEGAEGVVIACPLLEEKYRDVIRIVGLTRSVGVHFIHVCNEVDLEVAMGKFRCGGNGSMDTVLTKRRLEILGKSRGRKNYIHLLISTGDNLADFDTARRIIGEVLVENQ